MHVSRKGEESASQNVAASPEVPEDVRLWLEMMKNMLECAAISTTVIANAKHKLNFSKRDLEKFEKLDRSLDEMRLQMTSLGQSFCKPRTPARLTVAESSTQSLPIQRKNCDSQTNDTDRFENKKKRKSKNMDACLCGQFAEETMLQSTHNKISVCSTLDRLKLINYKCDGCSSQRTEGEEVAGAKQDFKDLPNNDDHPYIIKESGKLRLPITGVGYELFVAMHRFPDRIAQYIEANEDHMTFSELLRVATCCAIKLKAKNLNEDSIICLCVNNSKYSCVPYLAGFFIGCQMNALDLSFSPADIKFLMKLVTPDILFVQREKLPIIAEALKTASLHVNLVSVNGGIEGFESLEDYLDAPEEEIKQFKPYEVDSLERTCVILFSSGTEGLPKALCLTHQTMLMQFILSNAIGIFRHVFLSFTSYYWISAVIFLAGNILSGSSRIVASQFDSVKIYSLIDKYRVDIIFMGPYEAFMLAKTPRPSNFDISSLKAVAVGGAHLNQLVYMGLRKILGCLVFQIYGQTETAGLIVKWSPTDPVDSVLFTAKPSACGRPYGDFWYKIVEEETGRILGPHQPGELCVKSDTMIMKGYFHADSSVSFDSYGWLKTGDLVYYDEYQCFYVIDRIKELIKFRQWHVTPTILEMILTKYPAVARAVVIGVPHEKDGEHPMGLILLGPGVDPATVDVKEVADFVNKQVDDRKQLRAGVKIIESIPLTATGKVKRRALKEIILNEQKV